MSVGFRGSGAFSFLRQKVSFLANGWSMQTRSMHSSLSACRKGRLSLM